MDDREIPRDEVARSRERVSEVAHELRRRAKPAYLKSRAKDAVKGKAVEMKERTLGSPWALGVIGGLCTAGIAKLILDRRESRMELSPRVSYGGVTSDENLMGEALPLEGNGNGGRLDHLKGIVSDKSHAVKEKLDAIREHLPTGYEIREKAHEVRERAATFAENEPLVVALGAVALGAALGFLIPVSRKERELIGPYKEQVSDKAEGFMRGVTDKVEGLAEKLEQSSPPLDHAIPPIEPPRY